MWLSQHTSYFSGISQKIARKLNRLEIYIYILYRFAKYILHVYRTSLRCWWLTVSWCYQETLSTHLKPLNQFVPVKDAKICLQYFILVDAKCIFIQLTRRIYSGFKSQDFATLFATFKIKLSIIFILINAFVLNKLD